jgi:putative nucleotidyltransferase with HDIG domain
MTRIETIKQGVRKSLPELELIRDEDLRGKLVDAFALALSETEYERIEDMPSEGVPGSPAHVRHTQADHFRGTALIALGMAQQAEKALGPLEIDPDMVLACGLAHDIGKAYEFSPRNQKRWKNNTARYGRPAIRHAAYGVHVCLKAGLPEEVAHCAGYHSGGGEGEWIQRSVICGIVADADLAYWHIVDRAGLLDRPMFDASKTIIKLGVHTRQE